MTHEIDPLENGDLIAIAPPSRALAATANRAKTGLGKFAFVFGGLAIVGVGLVASVAFGVVPNPLNRKPSTAATSEPSSRVEAASVKAIHPKRDESAQLSIEQLATVEPYYRADLRARASGLVVAVHKNIGDRVRRGDVLVEIDVPDLVQDVAQKQAVIGQRQQELRVSLAHRKDTEAGREVAKAVIREKQSLVTQVEATRDFRKKRLDRLTKLAATDSVVAGVIDEEERDYAASDAAVMGAKVTVERSEADLKEAESKIEGAIADIDLKASMVEVARRDRDKARALADYARIVAPFDGVVVRRTVDPGSFVQNATTGSSEALISVARIDILTVVAKITDSAASFITDDTEVEITVNNLPGEKRFGRVTRHSPSIQNSDRTMRVEVDLYNGKEKDYRLAVARVFASMLSPLSSRDPFASAAMGFASHDLISGLHKGDCDCFPLGSPRTSNGTYIAGRLLPGMTVTMKLSLRQFHDGCIVPSTAVYSRTGRAYILLVENGVTRQQTVQVQLNDGQMAKVLLITKSASGETTAELTGHEVVVTNRQLEIGEGAAVKPEMNAW